VIRASPALASRSPLKQPTRRLLPTQKNAEKANTGLKECFIGQPKSETLPKTLTIRVKKGYTNLPFVFSPVLFSEENMWKRKGTPVD
jgi:hypothetical protein